MPRQLKIAFLCTWIVLFSPGVRGEAAYVGRAVCAQWVGSNHDLAMQHADDDSVPGDFSDATFSYAGITSTFYKENQYCPVNR